MEALFSAILMGIVGGPALAWAMTQQRPRQRYEASKAKFLAGHGRDQIDLQSART